MDQQSKKINPLKKAEDKVKNIIGKHLGTINKQYNTSLQLARFTDLKAVQELRIIMEAGLDKDEDEKQGYVYFINGAQQPTDKVLFEKFTYLFINMLDNKINQKYYTLVYFVGDEIMSSAFTRFREFMKLLPVKYYVRLKQMFVYHASLLVRSFLFFENSKRGKLWKKRTRFIGDLIELSSIPYFHKQWIELIPKYFQEQVDMTDLNNQRNDFIALNPLMECKNILSIFGRDLSSYTLNQMGIPEVLDHLLSYFSQRPERLNQVGVFRKSGSLTEQMQLAQLLSEGMYESLKIIDDINIVADILKKYFHSLAVPLISFTQYNMIISQIPELREIDALEFIQNVMEQLPILNRRVLSVVISFLLDVVKCEDLNKMTNYNISVVFAPCLMWPKNHTNETFMNIGLCIKFVSLMLKYYTTIFPEISYKIFLQKPISRESSSENSSQGTEHQLMAFGEGDQKERADIVNPPDCDMMMIDISQSYSLYHKNEEQNDFHIEMSEGDILSALQINFDKRQQKQTSQDELEFSIDSIMDHVKHNQRVSISRQTIAENRNS